MRRRAFGKITVPAWACICLLSVSCPPATAAPGSDGSLAAESRANPTVIFLARHAEKETGSDPELTEQGRSRAAHLAWLLRNEALDAVLSTPFRRTLQTAQAVAESKELEIVVTPIEGSAAEFVAGLGETILRDYRGKRILVVGHSNTVPETMDALGAREVPRLTDQEYEDLFVVIVPSAGTLTWLRLSYPSGD